ncbi:MAG: hypothetical protein ACJAT3_002236 [Akkermansiaceae bacterium]|jgi:hypothetical protein|tara:strand:- start:169 stop:273 length:105 start_codon:yes stop_codon:yes gene_type:complete
MRIARQPLMKGAKVGIIGDDERGIYLWREEEVTG